MENENLNAEELKFLRTAARVYVCQFCKKNIDLILYIVFYWYNMR